MPRPPKINYRQRGFFTFAQNNGQTDYVRLAYLLALNLKHTQKEVPYLSIGVTPGTVVPNSMSWAFDNIIEIPWNDDAAEQQWKLLNEWKAIHVSPYEETVKLDADMMFFNDISLWWQMMAIDEFVICNRVVDYRGNTITDDRYRKAFTVNNLPSIYTAFMYFKKTQGTHELFALAKNIFYQWEGLHRHALEYDHRPSMATTDIVFAMALKCMDLDGMWYRERSYPCFTHMKSHLQGWEEEELDDKWYLHLPAFVTPDLDCFVGNHRQSFPFHYHAKEFATDQLIRYHERKLRT